MASVNKAIIMGNVGRDPEIRYLPSGKATCSISVATSTKRKNKDTGETTEETQWHRVQFFDRLAEIAGEYVKKGRPVYIEGRIKYGKYTDQAGVEKNTVDIVATELQLLGGNDSDAPRSRSGPIPRGDSGQRTSPSHDAASARQAPPLRPNSGSGFDDDDVPF